MKKIALTGQIGKGKYALVDNEDFESLNRYKWHFHKNRKGDGYAARNVWNKKTKTTRIKFLHSFLLAPFVGKVTDHISGDKLDNRKANLRVADLSQNQHNRVKIGVSKYKNLSKKPFHARIQVRNKRISLGYFATFEEAKKAHIKATMQFHGDFANFSTI